MPFSKENKPLNINLQFKKIRFMEDSDRIFEDKLQKERTGHFTSIDSGNIKHRPQA